MSDGGAAPHGSSSNGSATAAVAVASAGGSSSSNGAGSAGAAAAVKPWYGRELLVEGVGAAGAVPSFMADVFFVTQRHIHVGLMPAVNRWVTKGSTLGRARVCFL